MNKVTSLLAIKANTRLVLATELVARNAECEALRTQLSVMQGSGAGTQPQASAPKVIAPRALPAHFVAAREAAMRLGKCVRVEA